MADVNVKINVDASQGVQQTQSLKQKMKELKDQMGAILASTNGLTDATAEQRAEYNRLEKEMANLTDIQGDMAARVKTLANDNMKLSATMQGAQGLIAGFGAVQGAMALVGGESEDLVKILTKLQAAQALLNSVNQLATVTNKDSAVSVALRSVKEKLLTKDIETQTKAQIALNVAKKAGVGAAIALGAALVALAAHYLKARLEQQKLTKELNASVAQAVGPTIQKVKELQRGWKNLGDSMAEKQQFVKNHADTFKELGVNVNSVKDAEKFIVDNADSFIEAEKAKAKATAIRSKLSESYAKQLELEMQYVEMSKKGLSFAGIQGAKAFTEDLRNQREDIAKTIGSLEKLLDTTANDIPDVVNDAVTGTTNAVKELEDEEQNFDAMVDAMFEKKKGFWDDDIEEGRNWLEEQVRLQEEAMLQQMEYDEQNERMAKARADRQKEIDRQKFEDELQNANNYYDGILALEQGLQSFISARMEDELAMAEGNEEEQAKIKKKYAKQQFMLELGNIVTSTAQAIMNTWASYEELGIPGTVLAAIQTATLAATGGAQLVTAKTAMNKALSGKAGRGAFIEGNSHMQGGQLWELEGGEAVLNKRAMAIPQYRAMASYMNESTGGVSFMKGSKSLLTDNMLDRLADRIASSVTSIPVVVSERNITDAQRRVQVINTRSSY